MLSQFYRNTDMDKFQKTVIFTKTPLVGYFRYADKFQIYPAELVDMPKSSLQEHYPVILEYYISDEEVIVPATDIEGLRDLRTLTATTLTKQDEILNLLTLFTNHHFFRYSDLTGTWGMPILKDDPGEEANSWSSKWNMIMFHWPGLPAQLKIEKFTEIELAYEPVQFVPFLEYYQKNPNLDTDDKRVISFPNNIFLGLDSFYQLDSESRSVIDDAISHAVSGIELRRTKKTLSVISGFTAIETMVNFENKDFVVERCEKCGQPQYKVVQHYRDYLLKYIGDNPNNKKKFNAFYNLRSKFIHTGARYKTEYLWNDLPKEESNKELISQLEVILMSKMAIVNWLVIKRQEQLQLKKE